MAERVKRVIELMQGDPSRAFTLGKMAESVNLSPPYFCYLFKSITGVPPAKYLKTLRSLISRPGKIGNSWRGNLTAHSAPSSSPSWN